MCALPVRLDKVGQTSVLDAIFHEKKPKSVEFLKSFAKIVDRTIGSKNSRTLFLSLNVISIKRSLKILSFS